MTIPNVFIQSNRCPILSFSCQWKNERSLKSQQASRSHLLWLDLQATLLVAKHSTREEKMLNPFKTSPRKASTNGIEMKSFAAADAIRQDVHSHPAKPMQLKLAGIETTLVNLEDDLNQLDQDMATFTPHQ